MDYHKYIRSKAVRDYLISNNIQLYEYEIVSILELYSKFESVKIKLFKQFLKEAQDKNMIDYMRWEIYKFNKSLKFMESKNDGSYVYIVDTLDYPEKFDRPVEHQIFDNFQDAYNLVNYMHNSEDLKAYSYTIRKCNVSKDFDQEPEEYSITYAKKETSKALYVLEYNCAIFDNDDNEYKGPYKCECPFIPHPFKIGDRIKPVHFNDIDTRMCGKDNQEATLFRSDKQYDKDINFWFSIDTKTADDIAKIRNMSTDYMLDWIEFDAETGIVCSDNQGLPTFFFDYEDDINEEYHTCFTADEDYPNMIKRVAKDLQNLLKGNMYRLQDVIECSFILRSFYQMKRNSGHIW